MEDQGGSAAVAVRPPPDENGEPARGPREARAPRQDAVPDIGTTLGLAGTELAQATAGSVRLKLLKVAAQVRVSVRRVYVQLSSAYPLQALFRLCHRRLMRLALPSG